MIDFLDRANYLLTGDHTVARTLSICLIAISILIVIMLLFKVFRVRSKSASVAVSAILVAFCVSACFYIAPFQHVRYQADYGDFTGDKVLQQVAETRFQTRFKGINVSYVKRDGYQYVAYVGSTGQTVVVLAVPEGVTVYKGESSVILTIADEQGGKVAYVAKYSANGYTEQALHVTTTPVTVTSLSTRYGVIKTTIPVYDSTYTNVLYQGGYEHIYEAE